MANNLTKGVKTNALYSEGGTLVEKWKIRGRRLGAVVPACCRALSREGRIRWSENEEGKESDDSFSVL